MPENGRKPDSASSRAGYGGARLMERVRAECLLRYEREVLPGMLYAVIETGGKQVKVTEGEVVFLENLFFHQRPIEARQLQESRCP